VRNGPPPSQHDGIPTGMADIAHTNSLGAPSAASRTAIIPWLEAILFTAFLIVPAFVPDYLADFASRLLILSLFAISFDLVFGYAGILSFGQALFFGGAGYVVALLARDVHVSSVFVVIPVSILVGLVLAMLVAGFLMLGRHPPTMIFVALGTLTASYIGQQLALSWYYLGGQNGIPSIPELTAGVFQFDSLPFFYMVFVIFVLVYAGCRALVRSQLGLALVGVRDQEERVGFFGYRAAVLKATIFAIAGAIAGLAGGLYAYQQGFVWPSMIGIVLSTQIVLYCLFGGIGTLVGPILGVIVIEGFTYVFSEQYPTVWPILLGLLLLLVILLRPSGVISLVVSERERVGDFGRWRAVQREEHAAGGPHGIA
jgi:branched-chain amino acid transport system permease protein